MNTFLVTDTHQPLGLGIVKELLPDGYSVIGAPAHDSNVDNYKSLKKKPLAVVPWNKKSPISAKNIVLQGVNKFSKIESAIIILAPDIPEGDITQTKYIDIENGIDIWLKGIIFLIRELLIHFKKQNFGLLSCVHHDFDIPSSPINELCIQSITSFIEKSAVEFKNSTIHINQFYSKSADTDGFAEFIVSTIKEKCYKSHAKLFRY